LDKRKNVIILTGGLAGSSVLTSLLARGGYWTGDDTFKKKDYDTWENAELVDLNKEIIRASGFEEDWIMEFRPDFVDQVRNGFRDFDTGRLQRFIDKCGDHQPWIWKDPLLSLTIRIWRDYLDLSRTAFLLIHREPLQAWISTTIRRQIQTVDYLRRYNDGIHSTILDFVGENDATYVNILYEDLILDPTPVIRDINSAAGTDISVDDFKAVFRGTLHRKQHGLKNYLHAKAIYFKNYSDRYR